MEHTARRADRDPGGPGPQPEGRGLRPAPQPPGRDHRPLRVRQEQPRLRHPLRGGPAPLRGEPLRLRPPVPRADGEAGRGVRDRPLPRHRHRAAHDGRHPRSTVGTVTEIYDHLRVLFAALGQPHCPRAASRSPRRARRRWRSGCSRNRRGRRVAVLAPVVRGRKGAFRKELHGARRRRATCGRASTGKGYNLAEPPRPRPAAQPPHRRARGSAGPPAGCREAAARRAWRRRSTSRSDVALVSFEGGPERLLQPPHGLRALRRLGARAEPARVLLQQPLRRLPRLRGAGRRGGRWTPRGHAGRGADAPRGRDPSLAAPRPAPGARGARGGGATATASRWRCRSASCRSKALQVLLHGDEHGFPGVVPYLRRGWSRSCARARRRARTAARTTVAPRPSRTSALT